MPGAREADLPVPSLVPPSFGGRPLLANGKCRKEQTLADALTLKGLEKGTRGKEVKTRNQLRVVTRLATSKGSMLKCSWK